jgi:hypothetical protein
LAGLEFRNLLALERYDKQSSLYWRRSNVVLRRLLESSHLDLWRSGLFWRQFWLFLAVAHECISLYFGRYRVDWIG